MKTEYTDTASEYQAVRGGVGLVDYQGAGLVRVGGNDAAGFLGSVATRAVDFLLEGQISSALILDEAGGVLSEVAIHCQGGDYLVEIWPAQAGATTEHLLSAATAFPDAVVTDLRGEFAVLGLEGPESPQLAQKFLPFPISSMAYRSFVTTEYGGEEILVSRTGVSGEYGYKLLVPVAAAPSLHAELVSLGAAEVGSAALDVCRMEMRFANIEAEGAGASPFAYGLQWMVDFSHEFIGRDALSAAWEAGLATAPVCFVADECVTDVPAAGTAVSVADGQVGAVAHAVFSPSLGRVIGTAQVRPEVAGSGLEFAVGEATVRTVSAPFLVATSFGRALD